jgi:fumarate hydratase class I
MTQSLGVGAQFGGKYFCHDVRVIRLPRHGASLPIGLGVSCSADRQAMGKITKDGVFLEELEHNPAKYLPEVGHLKARRRGGEDRPQQADEGNPRPAHEISDQDAAVAHRADDRGARPGARQAPRAAGEGAGAARLFQEPSGLLRRAGEDPAGYASGAFGPTTAGRMDSFVADFQKAGGSMVMLAKGNRSPAVTAACKQYGGFYLGSIGGVAANLAEHCIKKVETVEYPELGMEAIWRIEVVDFPAFIVVDDKGNDFFKELNLG